MARSKSDKPRLHTASRGLWKLLGPASKRLRHAPTDVENLLWQSLRRGALGVHFRRQHVIDRFIVDFLCVEAALVIEVDGPIHELQAAEDKVREDRLRAAGYRVLRFFNAEVERDLPRVLDRIRAALNEAPASSGAPAPNPTP